MAYRYIFTPACIRDVEDLAQRRQHRLIIAMLVNHIPTILADPHGAGEPKRGALRGYFGFTLSRGAGAAYRLVYTIEGEVVIFRALGEHDAAYRDAERRRQ
jgi:mRNA-degrading endonuclease RelE of RelBE toxin-antitoxin system